MRRLLIVWHSITGGTKTMAAAAAEGARAERAVETILLAAGEAGPDDLLAADAYLFALPETLAAISGGMKTFFDRSYYPALGAIEGRTYAALICAGSDGSNAARQVERVAAGWRLRAVAEPLIVHTQAQTPDAILAPKTIPAADLTRCRDLGGGLATGLALGIY